jgi:hypothetical protein
MSPSAARIHRGAELMGIRGWKLLLRGIWLSAIFGVLASMAIPNPARAQKETTLTGIIGDTRCGNAHDNPNAKACTVDCVKHMSSYYALIIGQRSYMLQGKVDGLEALAGQKAKITGVLRSDGIMVTSASQAQ